MHEMKEKLIQTGVHILSASKTELYVSMRFLDIALNSLGYEMDLSMRTIGTDSKKIRFNPRYLVENYQNDRVLVNRVYLHMILHCVFRHMYHNRGRDEEIWNLACDIAVESIIDHMTYRSVSLTVSDQRSEMYDYMGTIMPVLTAEGIYKALKSRPLTYFEMESAKKQFTADDHVFWQSEGEDDQNEGDNKNNDDGQDHENQEQKTPPENPQSKEQEDEWERISEKMRTNMETYSRDATDAAGGLYDYIKIVTRERYDYRKFLQRFTVLREEIRLDQDSFDYIYYTYGLEHYGNMPLIEPLEYKEVKKIEEFAIVIDTSESCSGDIVRRFLEETFAILTDRANFFKKVNVHIIQCDVAAQQDTVITCEADMKKYMENFKITGFGGTDFRPAFEYIDKLCRDKVFHHLKGMIYFTDGFGMYPKKKPAYDAAFVFLEESYNDREVPPWAIKLILGPEDIKGGCAEDEH